jgi:hypothetical protein
MAGGKGFYVGGTLLSLTAKRESAIFVGLSAPTILNPSQSLLDQGSPNSRIHPASPLRFTIGPPSEHTGGGRRHAPMHASPGRYVSVSLRYC